MYNAVVHGMGRLLASFYDFIPSYGIGIVLLTVLVRVGMIPLAVKQFHIMQANRANAEKMRKLLPEVKKIKEKYRDDRTKQYEEQKKLYDQHGVNMLGGLSGCLPMLVQMPVFMAMYSVLSGCNKIFGSGRRCTEGFHIPDGSALKAVILEGRDTFLGMNLNLAPSGVLREQGLADALPYYVLVALMGYTMWYQTRQMMKAQPVVDPQMAQTQKVMQFMPLLLIFASLSFPAGLTVYWTATNVWSIAQQYVLLRRVGELVEATGKKPAAAKGRLQGLVSRLRPAAEEAEPKGGRRSGRGAKDVAPESKESPAKRGTKPAGTKPGAKPAAAKPGTKPAAAKPAVKPAAGKAAAAKPGNEPSRKPAARSARKPAPSPDGMPTPEEAKAALAADSKSENEPVEAPATPIPTGSGAAKSRPKAAKPGDGSGTAASGPRKPAANRARAAGSGQGNRPKGSSSKTSGSASGSAPGRGGTGSGSSPGRPKGSGARKKGKGGHR